MRSMPASIAPAPHSTSAAPDLDRIARLAERTSGFDIETIKGTPMRQPDR